MGETNPQPVGLEMTEALPNLLVEVMIRQDAVPAVCWRLGKHGGGWQVECGMIRFLHLQKVFSFPILTWFNTFQN